MAKAETLNGTLKGAMVGAPLIFINNENGKEYRTLANIKSIRDFGKKIRVVTDDGAAYFVDK